MPAHSTHFVSKRNLRLAGWAALALAVITAAAGIAIRLAQGSTLHQWTEEQAIPSVSIVRPAPGDANLDLVFPGNLRAFLDAPIYARVGGYLKRWYVDIGTPVKAGQLLAEIETPELDQQLHQAEADLVKAKANARVASVTAKRWQEMLASDSVSQQEADEKTGDSDEKAAEMTAAKANVDRLKQISAFRRIVAPFDGVVTARKTDVGALINPGAANGGELFRVADMRKARVYVEIPQNYAAAVTVGMQAELTVPEDPDHTYPAKVVDTSRSISEVSRTLLVQLEADNAEGKLLPGSYAEVHFKLPAHTGTVRLPTSALLFREHGLEVATLGADDKVVLKKLQLGRDFGTEVEVVKGLSTSDKVIDSPPDSLAQGDSVRLADDSKTSGATPKL